MSGATTCTINTGSKGTVSVAAGGVLTGLALRSYFWSCKRWRESESRVHGFWSWFEKELPTWNFVNSECLLSPDSTTGVHHILWGRRLWTTGWKIQTCCRLSFFSPKMRPYSGNLTGFSFTKPWCWSRMMMIVFRDNEFLAQPPLWHSLVHGVSMVVFNATPP